MGQEAYLQNARLKFQVWRSDRQDWDHDYCLFCQRHISVPLSADDEDAVDRGYSTKDNYHWVCETCFGDFCDQFGWLVVPATT
jgi:hypothetical protein